VTQENPIATFPALFYQLPVADSDCGFIKGMTDRAIL
jgi:hypothetical protein